MRRAVTRWAGFAIYLLALTGLLEGLARLVIARPVEYLEPDPDPELLYRLKPGVTMANGTLFKIDDFRVVVGRQHCRIPSDGIEAFPPDRTRILFVGDSFTFSQGVDFERAYPWLIQETLNAQGWSPPVQAIDCAVDGYNFTQIVRSAEQRLETFRPDLLVVPLFLNDLNEPFQLQKMFPKSDAAAWFIRHVRLVRLAVVLKHALADAVQPVPLAPAVIDRGVDRILAAARATGTRVLFLLLSDVPHPEVDLPALLTQKQADWLRLPDFHTPELTFPRNGHWNPRGHARVADWLTPRIAERLEAAAGSPGRTGQIPRGAP